MHFMIILNKLKCLSPAKPFWPSVILAGKARIQPKMGAPERCFTWVGSGLTHRHYTRLERVVREKHTSLLRKIVTIGRKKFYNTDPWGQYYKTLFRRILRKG
jgi:hypothetical protein